MRRTLNPAKLKWNNQMVQVPSLSGFIILAFKSLKSSKIGLNRQETVLGSVGFLSMWTGHRWSHLLATGNLSHALPLRTRFLPSGTQLTPHPRIKGTPIPGTLVDSGVTEYLWYEKQHWCQCLHDNVS